MNRPSYSVANLHEDESEDTVDKLPRKKIKLDPEAQQSSMVNSVDCEVAAKKVKMDDLPDLVIVTILSFLPLHELTQVVPKVCTKWRSALSDPVVWLNKTYIVRKNYSEAEVLSMLRRVPQLRSLDAKWPLSDAILNALCDNCKHLNRLEFNFCQEISNSLLSKLVMNCGNIKSLTIPEYLLTDESSAQVLAQLLHLQSLKIKLCNTFNKRLDLAPLGTGCPELSKLEIWTNCLYMEELKLFLEGKFRTLTHLALSRIDKNGRCIIPLLKDCSNLVKLELYSFMIQVGDVLESLTALRHLSNLRSLTLGSGAILASAEGAAIETDVLLDLQVLNIRGLMLENSVFAAIFEGCPNLKELHLTDCWSLCEADLKELYRLKNLEVLVFIRCKVLCAAGLLHVCYVPNLRKLRIERCEGELKDALPFILYIRTLEILHFTSVEDADYFPFDCIPERLPNLRVLTVEDCDDVDPRTMEQLKQRMPRLWIHYDFDSQ